MEKSEKLILQSFLKFKVPYDFNVGILNNILIDSLSGLVSRALQGEKLSKAYIEKYDISAEHKLELSKIVSNNEENLIYYNIIKNCFLILYKYSN